PHGLYRAARTGPGPYPVRGVRVRGPGPDPRHPGLWPPDAVLGRGLPQAGEHGPGHPDGEGRAGAVADLIRRGPQPMWTNLATAGAPVKLGGSVERVAAGAAPLGHGVVDGEARGLQAVHEVDLGLLEVRHAHPVDHDPDPEL